LLLKGQWSWKQVNGSNDQFGSYPGLLVMTAGYLVTKFLKEIK